MSEHILNTENFRLLISLKIFEDDINSSSNTIMTVSVTSDGFFAKADMDIDIKEFAAFANKLSAVYESLIGTATIKEPYGHQKFITFSADKTGYITVKGFLCDNLKNNELRFENNFDQTYLKPFSQQLCSAYSKYIQ
ncbi:MAG: hypothetical protein IKH51_09915 [Clostridia bacterium]|nr:hypothetical protein [Clostridia bacterium]